MSYPSSYSGRRSRVSLSLLAFLLPLALAATVPTDNPVLAHYAGDPHEDDYLWTAEIPWGSVFNILDYGAVADGNGIGDGVGVTDNSAAFAAAVDAAYAAGGGVVFMPAGIYYFADTIYLKPGVVVRGETPVVTDAQDANFAPPTKLEFPKYFFDPIANGGAGYPKSSAFKVISVTDNSLASNIGLVWLDINRAQIKMAADGEGTRNRLVFGIRNNNVAEPGTDVPKTTYEHPTLGTIPYQHAWQRYSYRFCRNIHLFAQENALVANNRVNDKHYIVQLKLPGWEAMASEVDDFIQPGYIIRDEKKIFGSDRYAMIALDATKEPWFNYTNHYAIYVRGGSATWGAAPWQGPSLFRSGTTVRDNWVYSTMRVGYHLSGWGLKVLNNVKKDRPGKKWWIYPDGLTSVHNSATLENRGIDIAGSRILVDGNNLQIERHLLNGGPYSSVDGEGILVQECCGGTTLDDVTISNNELNAYISAYKMPYTRDIKVTGNKLLGPAYIYISADPNGTQAPAFDVVIDGNDLSNGGGIRIECKSGGGGNFITNNIMNGGVLNYPPAITTQSGNTGTFSISNYTPGAVRDYPVLSITDPSTAGHVDAGKLVMLDVRVPGSYLVPAPAGMGDLPDVTGVQVYSNSSLIGNFTTGVYDPVDVAWTYTVPWRPRAGLHQLAAKATPAGYSGPLTSTEWFTVSDVVHVRADPGADLFRPWIAVYYPGESDPAVIGLDADDDGDGLTNGEEFAQGGNPAVPDVHMGPALVEGPGSLHFQVRLRNDTGNLHPRVLASTDLGTWSEPLPTDLTVAPDGPDFTIFSYTFAPAAGQRTFVQLEVAP